MSIAVSLSTIVFTDAIRGDSQANLLADIHSAVTAAGWSAATVADGHQYTIASPQGLGAKVRILAAAAGLVSIQFLSLDETKLGYVHYLGPGEPGRFYQLWANRCQLFISVNLVDAAPAFFFYAVQGGIPWVSPDSLGVCGLLTQDIKTTEAWWSAGDGAPFDRASLRNAFALGVNGAWSACRNATLTDGTAGTLKALRLIPKAIALPAGLAFGAVARMQYFGGAPLYFDPLIFWGGAVIGELWDAMIPSLPRPVDAVELVCEALWINYMHSKAPGEADTVLAAQAGLQVATRWASLYLLLDLPPGPSGRKTYVY